MKIIIAVLILVFIFPSICLAQQSKESFIEAVEFLYGNARGDLRKQDNYELYHLIVDFDLNLKALLENWNSIPKNLVQLQIEPFVSYVYSPAKEREFGTSFLLKIGLLPESWKFQPYIKAGLGIIYMTLETLEQGSQFNFTEQAGIGMHYFLTDNTAVTAEYRIRHLSNADLKEPNAGINTDTIIAGITYKF